MIAVAGLHVDDVLIAGEANRPAYSRAKEEHQRRFKFGKWDRASGDGLVFAGTQIRQSKEGVPVNQRDSISGWIAEVPLTPARAKQLKAPLTPAEKLSCAAPSDRWPGNLARPGVNTRRTSCRRSSSPVANVKTLIDTNKSWCAGCAELLMNTSCSRAGAGDGKILPQWFGRTLPKRSVQPNPRR